MYPILGVLMCLPVLVWGQFAGAVGTVGSTAIPADSSIFVSWATQCSVVRGFLDVASPELGYASLGDSSLALGKAGTNGVVSLGDAGYAILQFDNPISDGNGWDFAVFENSFNDHFLELATVSVSSDGVHFFTFAPTSNTQTGVQMGSFDNTGDATKLNNLAGKYRGGYGTPFDLAELANIPNLNISAVTHIKVTDVIGRIEPPYVTLDASGNAINDPYPTPFESGGFDLDAVGVIHEATSSSSSSSLVAPGAVCIYPNPSRGWVEVRTSSTVVSYCVRDMLGNVVLTEHPAEGLPLHICTEQWTKGVYHIQLVCAQGRVYVTSFVVL
jgi:hypothetical protein